MAVASLPVMLATAAVVVAGVLLLARLGACTWSPLCGPLLADDVAQGRLDTALPAPQGALVIEQSFVPAHDGLTAVELLFARYDGQPPAEAHLDVALWDDAGAPVAAESLPVAALTNNQGYTLTFAPQRDSAGRRYILRLSGSEGNPVSAWGYSLDVYGGGELTLDAGSPAAPPPTAARELRFVTRYALTGGGALAAAVAPLRQELPLLLVAALLLPLPGVWLVLLFRPHRWGRAVGAGAALALGVAAWPLLWLWLSLIGGRWSAASLWTVVAVGWLGVAVLAVRQQLATQRGLPTRATTPTSTIRHSSLVTRHFLSPLLPRSPAPLLLLLLLAAAVAVRFVAVRDQAFPPWVDSSRHALITAVMVDSGRAPDGYAPYLPVQGFPYHFGFHTLSAGLALLTGRPLSALLLTLGQLLNGLVPLAVFAAGRLATERRSVGLLAAFLVALPFFFPGYYATWGRMTQLTAMLIMPVLLALTWRLGRGWARLWPLVGVLAAGLFLVHFRVFLFYLPFAALVGAIEVAKLIRDRRQATSAIIPLLLAGALALLLVMPRFVRLLADTDPLATFGQSQPGYNDFPLGYVTTGWEAVYLGLAADAALIVLIAAFYRRRWATFPLTLLAWVAALFVLLAGDRLGLPETLVVNLNSMYITLFLPLSLLLSIVTVEGWRWLEERVTRDERRGTNEEQPATSNAPLKGAGKRKTLDAHPPPATRHSPLAIVYFLLTLLAGAALGLLALFGARQQANILNPQTVLALPQDTAALEWMDANLPAGARVAVNAWQWLGVTWAGSDGGAWIVPLTRREATTPPVDHIYDAALFEQVRAFNQAAMADRDWSDLAAAGWLRDQGVTHVYAGQRGGPLDPAELSRNPGLTLLFHSEGTFVFEVTSGE